MSLSKIQARSSKLPKSELTTPFFLKPNQRMQKFDREIDTYLDSYSERCENTIMILCVFSNPGVTVVDVCLNNVLIYNLRHHNKPLGKEVSLK